jgi:uncharacterized membrane protein YphA (DoxX/SURF4 family)
LGVSLERVGQAHILTPFVSGIEFFGGIFLLLGLLTRISAGALGITMIVAIASAKWDQVDSLETLLGFDETEYLALFLWLSIAGGGLEQHVSAWRTCCNPRHRDSTRDPAKIS